MPLRGGRWPLILNGGQTSRPYGEPPPRFGVPRGRRCAKLLGVDLVTVSAVAAEVEPYLRVDGTKVWSLMQLERRLRSEAYRRAPAAASLIDAR